MPRAKPASKDGLTKFQRYRRARTDKGMKLLRRVGPRSDAAGICPGGRSAGPAASRPAGGRGSLAFIEAAFPWPDR